MGALLGLGAPLGFLVLRGLRRRRPMGRGGRLLRRSGDRLALAYMGVATPAAFSLFGLALGRREREIRRAHAEVERLRDEHVAIVAHDLRRPIQVLLLQVEALLRSAGHDPAEVDMLRRIQGSGKRLAYMIDDLRDASLLESSRMRLSPVPVAVPEAVSALLDRIRPTLGERRVELVVEGRPSPVLVDPIRLDQIVTNLVENAAKYSQEGSQIAVRVRAAEGGTLLQVEDRGPGIAPEDLPKLFDRFYQAKRAREKKTGLGLGLYITKGLVDAHHGRIHVASVVGRGSVFSVWLPSARRP